MGARMNLFLTFALGLGVGALVLSISARRKAERALLGLADSPAPLAEASQTQPIAEPAIAEPAIAEPRTRGTAAPETPEPPANRRKHRRIRSDQSFVITPFAGRAIMAQCRDVSTGGMRFGVVGCTLRVGDLVRVTFNIGAETVAAIGSVVRVQELDPITSDVSLEFVRGSVASQLLAGLEADGLSGRSERAASKSDGGGGAGYAAP